MRPEGLTIRPARIGERAQLEDLQRRASLIGPYRDDLLAFPDAIELPAEQFERGQALVAESEGRVAAFAVVLDNQGKAELDGLFVEPELWRQGIGSALVADAAHQARRQGLSLTMVASPEARVFYEKCGFTVEQETETRFGPALLMSR